MPDRTPEHHDYPPQWPPLPSQSEPDSRSTYSEFDSDHPPGPSSPPPEWPMPPSGDDSFTPPTPTPSSGLPTPREPVKGALDEGPQQVSTAAQAGNSGAIEKPPEPEQAPPKRVLAQPPPTHGRGVRMTIYGIGGAIAIGLIVVIIVMAGGTIIPSSDDEETTDTSTSGSMLLDENGDVIPENYRNFAAAAGTDEWISWRYGEPSNDPVTSETVTEPPSTPLNESVETAYQHGDASVLTNPRNVQGQVGYVGDSVGVDHVTTIETTDSTMGFTPRPGGRFSADSSELELTEGSTAKCLDGTDLGHVVAMDRSTNVDLSAHAVIAFSTGAIATAGISGAQGGTCVLLDDGLVPTAVAVTPGNEFALVTVWDTNELRGAVAVIALADTPGTYSSSWPKVYPGLPGPGHMGFAKLLGYVELPDMPAPTAISVSSDFNGPYIDRRAANLSNAASRSSYASDVATTGFAVIGSRAQSTVNWIDLTPLFKHFADTYFNADPSVYQSPGAGADEWPQTFATDGSAMPVVTGGTDVNGEVLAVTAVKGVAYVADVTGALSSFDLSKDSVASLRGTIDLDGPATCLSPTAENTGIVATSRTDRSVSWIAESDNGGDVVRILRDANLVDPICAKDNISGNSSATMLHTVSIADYSGQLHTYRYGEGQMSDGTDLSLDDSSFEYGGAYEPPGKPFIVSTTLDPV